MSANSKASPHVNSGGFNPQDAIDPSRALVPAVVRLNEQKVARGFWPKIRKVATKVPFAADALSVEARLAVADAQRGADLAVIDLEDALRRPFDPVQTDLLKTQSAGDTR